MMKSNLYGATIVASLFLSACSGSKTADGQLNVIPLEAAIDNPARLNVSDCFSQVSYIPLETNDSCLVGQAPRVQVIKDKILVSTNQNQCLMFDRTGKFIRQVGHVGNDPGGTVMSIVGAIMKQVRSISWAGAMNWCAMTKKVCSKGRSKFRLMHRVHLLAIRQMKYRLPISKNCSAPQEANSISLKIMNK